MDVNEFDGLQMQAFKEFKSVNEYLNGIFGFLARKTEFYKKNESEAYGGSDALKNIVLEALTKNDPRQGDVTYEVPDSRCYVPEFFIKANEKMGIHFAGYHWGQTIGAIELTAKLPKKFNLAHLLLVEISPERISIAPRIYPAAGILSGQIHSKLNVSEAKWEIREESFFLTCAKLQAGWWPRFFTDEYLIDLSMQSGKIDTTGLRPRTIEAIEKKQLEYLQRGQDGKGLDGVCHHAYVPDVLPYRGLPYVCNIIEKK